MRTKIIFAFALAAMPALAQPRLEVPVRITAIEPAGDLPAEGRRTCNASAWVSMA